MPERCIEKLEKEIDYFIQEYSITASISKILVKCIENKDNIDEKDLLSFAHQLDDNIQYLKERIFKIHQEISRTHAKSNVKSISTNQEYICRSSSPFS